MKLTEAQSLKLLGNKGFKTPSWCVAKNANDVNLPHTKFVIKANLAASGKKKSGLVVTSGLDDLEIKISEVLDKADEIQPFDSVLVEEFVEHENEHFIALKAVREGVEIYYSSRGGIEIESDWKSIARATLPTQALLSQTFFQEIRSLTGDLAIFDFLIKLVNFFQESDATYLEINPFTVVGSQLSVVPLGIVHGLDEAASYRHPEWEDPEFITWSQEASKTEREKEVARIDKEIKGSIKLVEVKAANPNLTAVVAGGAGAALYLCDAVVNNGLELADYAEFSGNPPSFAVAHLIKNVCKIPGLKNLVIGSGIANFTPVVGNVEGIIEGLRSVPEAKKLHIIFRRCGPGEVEGVRLMKEFAADQGYNIEVFDRYMGMTEIVKRVKK